ncbi:MAG TPA: 6-bladed beta-propeller [Bacteroidaceae bacterium]|nr:6-bladed beta-propeller [Bacteroidaceae bacterium]
MKDVKTATIMLLLSFSLSIISCKHRSVHRIVDVTDVSVIKYKSGDGCVLLKDSVVKKSSFIKLETDSTCLIGKIDKLLFADSLIIVVDQNIARSVLIFDMKGRFISKVSYLGNGPKEYIMLKQVFLTSEKEVAIYDMMKGKILLYDLKGNYISTISCKDRFNGIESIDSDTWALDLQGTLGLSIKSFNGYAFGVTDKDFNPSFAFGKNIFTKEFNISRLRDMYSFGGNIYFNVGWENTIYQLKKDSVIAKYRLVYEKDDFVDVDKEFTTNEEFDLYSKDNPVFNGEFIELKDYTYISYLSHSQKPFLLFEHKTGVTYSILPGGADFKLWFMERPIARYGENTLVECVSSTTISAFKNHFYSFFGSSSELDRLYDDLTPDSNPVLFFYDINFKH